MPASAERPQLTERDLLLSGARRDATAAHLLYKQIDTQNSDEYTTAWRVGTCLTVADAFIAAGLDFKPLIEEVDTLIDALPEERKHGLLGHKAELLCQAGDLESAVPILEGLKTPDLAFPERVWIKIARTSGNEAMTSRAIAKVEEVAGSERYDAWYRAYLYQKLAEIAGDKDGNPREFLEKAGDAIQKQHGERSYSYGSLAEAYASFGYFEAAYSLVDNVISDYPEDLEATKLEALRKIMRYQVWAGNSDEVRQRVMNTSDIYTAAVIETEILFKDISDGKKESINPTTALDYVARFEEAGVRRKNQSVEDDLVYLYGRVGEIHGKIGQDPMPFFEKAIENATKGVESDEVKGSSGGLLLDIAGHYYRVGLDPRPILSQILDLADSMKETYFGGAEKELLYEDVAKEAIDMGCFDISNRVLAWQSRNLREYEGAGRDDMIKLLTHRVEVQVKKAKALAV